MREKKKRSTTSTSSYTMHWTAAKSKSHTTTTQQLREEYALRCMKPSYRCVWGAAAKVKSHNAFRNYMKARCSSSEVAQSHHIAQSTMPCTELHKMHKMHKATTAQHTSQLPPAPFTLANEPEQICWESATVSFPNWFFQIGFSILYLTINYL